MKIIVGYIILLLLLFSSCEKKGNSFNGEIRYISQFRTTQHLKGEKLSYIQNIGIYGCDICYPYLLLNLGRQDSLVSIYDVEKKIFLDNMFTLGMGPNEFSSFVITQQYKDSVLVINDVHKQEISLVNLFESVRSHNVKFLKKISYEGMHEMVFYTDSLLWMKDVKQNRISYICSDSLHPSQILYKEKISGSDLNHFLLLADAIKPDATKLVTLSGVLNQIDILSLDSDIGKNFSVTTSPEMIRVSDLQESGYTDAFDYFLSIPRCNDDYIMVLHVSSETQKKHLYMIDWEGNGIADYIVNEDLVDFCVDWKHHVIYGVTADEEVYVYENIV